MSTTQNDLREVSGDEKYSGMRRRVKFQEGKRLGTGDRGQETVDRRQGPKGPEVLIIYSA
jgi:hypothetical protein